MPTKAFSSSSIHKIQGLIDSAIVSARRILCSLSPTYLPNNEPISRRRSGNWNKPDAALAARDFPQPGIPAISTPLGACTRESRASLRRRKIWARRVSQVLRFSRPPMSVAFSITCSISSTPLFAIICSFPCWIRANASSLICSCC